MPLNTGFRATLGDVLAAARTLLNDDNNTVFVDPVLIPKVQEAHRELQEELWIAGSPAVRSQTFAPWTIGSVIGTISPGPPIGSEPTLPDYCLCPLELFESGAAGGPYIPMTEVFSLPFSYTQGPTITYWAWQNERIYITSPSATRYVMMRYRLKLPIPTASTDQIMIQSGEVYLSARAAALAAGSLGNKDVHDALTALAKENLGKVIMSHRGSQKPLMKP